jgi:hypothetical protein
MAPAIHGQNHLVVAAAIWHLLQEANSTWYGMKNYRETDVRSENLIDHLNNINDLLKKCWPDCRHLAVLRGKQIEDLAITDQQQVSEWFESFKNILGPTGAAKNLHFIAPDRFPPWDPRIAQGRGKDFLQDKTGYWTFIEMRKEQCRFIKHAGFSEHVIGTKPLRALDEVDYHWFTQMKEGRD